MESATIAWVSYTRQSVHIVIDQVCSCKLQCAANNFDAATGSSRAVESDLRVCDNNIATLDKESTSAAIGCVGAVACNRGRHDV